MEELMLPAQEARFMDRIPIWAKRGIKKYGIAVLAIIALSLWTLTVKVIVTHNVTQQVREEVTAQMRANMQSWVDKQEQERTQATFKADSASLEEQMHIDATAIARAMEGIKTITERNDDLRTYAWNILFRTASKIYPNSVESVVSQKNQYMGYSENNPVVEGKYQIALECVQAYYSGNYPVSDKYLYAEWDESGKIILRDKYIADRGTSYWWWGK